MLNRQKDPSNRQQRPQSKQAFPMAELAALHGSLRVPTAEEIEKWGALEYHCALCQDPIFTSDFEQDEDQPERKPIAVCYPVPEEYQPEFGDATQVAVCLRANAACTTKYKKKLDKGGMLVQAAPGILCEGARKALPSNKSVVQLLKGEIDLWMEVVEPEPETLVPPAGESAATPAEPDDGFKRADKPPADMGAGAVDTDEVHPLASAASDDVGDSGLGESAAVAAAKTAKDSATDGAAPMAGLQPEADASPMAVGAGPVDTDGDKMLHPAKTSDVGGGGAESGGGGDAAQTSIVMDYQDPDDSNINFETEVPAAMPPPVIGGIKPEPTTTTRDSTVHDLTKGEGSPTPAPTHVSLEQQAADGAAAATALAPAAGTMQEHHAAAAAMKGTGKLKVALSEAEATQIQAHLNMKGLLLSDDRLTKQDLWEQCSLASLESCQTWKAANGASTAPYVFSSSTSTLAFADVAEHPVLDFSSPERSAMVIASFKVMQPPKGGDGRSTRGCAKTSDHGRVPEELTAMPFSNVLPDPKPTLVYCDMSTPGAQPLALLGPHAFAHHHMRPCTSGGGTRSVPFLFAGMINLLHSKEGRDIFKALAASAAGDEGLSAGTVPARVCLATAPVAILFCIDGSYVKANPELLRSDDNSGDPNNAYHKSIHEMYHAALKGQMHANAEIAKVNLENFTAIEVSTQEAQH